MKQQYFDGDSYISAESDKKGLLGGRLRRSHFLFVIGLGGVVLRSRRLALAGRYDLNQWTSSSIEILRLLERSGAKFIVRGLEKLRELDEPVVIVSNHMSTLETLVLPCLIAPIVDVTFVVKESLEKFPLFGPVMRARNPIIVSRNNSRNDLTRVLEQGSQLIADNTSIIIFPQSTRKNIFVKSEFNSLGTKLALKNSVKVLPVAIKTDYWMNGKVVKELGGFDRTKSLVHIEFGQPLTVSGNGREAHKEVLDQIGTRLRSWGVEVKD